MSGRGRWRAVMAAAVGMMAAAVAVASASEDVALWRLEGAVHALAVAGDRLVAAGRDGAGRAWFEIRAADDGRLSVRRRFADCTRCAFLDAVAVDHRRAVLVGSREERGTLESGWVALVDLDSGRVVRERTLDLAQPNRLSAVAYGFGKLLAAGSLLRNMGANVEPFVSEFEPESFTVGAEWPFPAILPRAALWVEVLAPESFLVGGWQVDAAGAGLGGWLARFTYKGEPVWRAALDREGALEASAAVVAPDGRLLVFGYGAAESLSDPARLRLGLGLRWFDLEEGAGEEGWRLSDPAVSRSAADAVARDHAVWLLASRRQGDRAPEEVELYRMAWGETPRLVRRLGDGERAMVPARLSMAEDGALWAGGWYRVEEGAEVGARGWLLRIDPLEAALELRLEPVAGDRVRAVVRNLGPVPLRVRALTDASVRLVDAEEAWSPLVGRVPGRPVDRIALDHFLELAPGDGAAVVLAVPDALRRARAVRALYSPDFAGAGVGRVLASAPLALEAEGRR